MAALDAMTPATPAHAAWQRALRMRVTQDWRILAAPATASRLEKLEYFRARRYTVPTRGGQDLTDMREPIAVDFGRIPHPGLSARRSASYRRFKLEQFACPSHSHRD